MAQINTIVGDLRGNRDKIIDHIGRAKKLGADIVAFPELAVTGYPPEDLVLKPQFVKDNLRTLKEVAQAAKGITAIVGFIDGTRPATRSAVLDSGSSLYPTGRYSAELRRVDEYRYFNPAPLPCHHGQRVAVGVNICEDIWYAEGDLFKALAGAGSDREHQRLAFPGREKNVGP
jgi:NAD+ synthase (glutamine-hydrolysing)